MYHQSSRRRKKPDPLLKLLSLANAGAALSLFIAFCLVAVAKPEIETFFDRFYKVNIIRRPNWDMDLMHAIAALLVFCCLISLTGIYLNSKRLKRKGDYIRATQIVSLIVALFGLGLYGYYLFTL